MTYLRRSDENGIATAIARPNVQRARIMWGETCNEGNEDVRHQRGCMAAQRRRFRRD